MEDMNYNVQGRSPPSWGRDPVSLLILDVQRQPTTRSNTPAASISCQPHWMLSCTGQTASLAENVTGILPVMVRLRGKEDRAPRTTAHCPTRQHNHQPCSLAFGSQWSGGVICARRTRTNPHHGGLSCQQAMLHRPLAISASMVFESKVVKGVPCNIAYPNTMCMSSTHVCADTATEQTPEQGLRWSRWWQRGHSQHSVCQHTPHKGITGCVQPAVSCN